MGNDLFEKVAFVPKVIDIEGIARVVLVEHVRVEDIAYGRRAAELGEHRKKPVEEGADGYNHLMSEYQSEETRLGLQVKQAESALEGARPRDRLEVVRFLTGKSKDGKDYDTDAVYLVDITHGSIGTSGTQRVGAEEHVNILAPFYRDGSNSFVRRSQTHNCAVVFSKGSDTYSAMEALSKLSFPATSK